MRALKILNIGSLNYDYVYTVDHILVPGETIAASGMETFCGGKGLNQSIALAKAGAEVWHAGMVGQDGEALLDTLREARVNVSFVQTIPGKSGHTVIQVDTTGQNGILLFGGSNRCLTTDYIDRMLSAFSKDDMLLLQNEVNLIPYIIDRAFEKGMTIAFNPSPYDQAVSQCDLSKVSILLINEIEGWQISGHKQPEDILSHIHSRYPDMAVVLTLGKEGVIYQDKRRRLSHGIYPVPVVDTTAAGDTFTGYFLSSLTQGKPVEEALELASKAAAIAVSRKGAAPSIPTLAEVLAYSFPEP